MTARVSETALSVGDMVANRRNNNMRFAPNANYTPEMDDDQYEKLQQPNLGKTYPL